MFWELYASCKPAISILLYICSIGWIFLGVGIILSTPIDMKSRNVVLNFSFGAGVILLGSSLVVFNIIYF